MQEKVEIITNHILQFWTKIPKNGYCVYDVDTQDMLHRIPIKWKNCKVVHIFATFYDMRNSFVK